MWENNQEMLQQYCDNNDQTNPILVNYGYFKIQHQNWCAAPQI